RARTDPSRRAGAGSARRTRVPDLPCARRARRARTVHCGRAPAPPAPAPRRAPGSPACVTTSRTGPWTESTTAKRALSGRAELLEEPRTLRSHRLVPLVLRDCAALELEPRLLRPLLPCEHLPQEQVRVAHVGALLGVAPERLARLVQPALLGEDRPQLTPSQAVLGRDRQRAPDLADALLGLTNLVQGPAKVALRQHPRLVERVARRLVQRRDRLGEASLLDVERAQVGHRLAVVRPHLQRPLEFPLAVLRPAERPGVDDAEAETGLRGLLVIDRHQVFLERALRVALVQQVVPELLVD